MRSGDFFTAKAENPRNRRIYAPGVNSEPNDEPNEELNDEPADEAGFWIERICEMVR